ncbi:GDYXXLXY domain-containing protein [Marinicauda salina]|nr:GDYXXLXY domain-containing protein [Marinicauda salina]
MNRTARLLAIAAAMTAILAGLVGHHAWRREHGAEIRLAMEPVDPRDILLGHYVAIRTPIHRLDTRDLDGPAEGWRRGEAVFVALRRDEDDAWSPVAIARTRAAAGANDRVVIRGRVERVSEALDFAEVEETRPEGEVATRREPVEGSARPALSVRYNLERYFAPEDAALALEDMRREDRLRLIVSVGEDGGAIIKGLEIDGEARYETLF